MPMQCWAQLYMALILIDESGKCFCNCADKCVVGQKSGMMDRCTKDEIKNSGHRPIEVFDKESDNAIMDFYCIDGSYKKIKVELKRI